MMSVLYCVYIKIQITSMYCDWLSTSFKLFLVFLVIQTLFLEFISWRNEMFGSAKPSCSKYSLCNLMPVPELFGTSLWWLKYRNWECSGTLSQSGSDFMSVCLLNLLKHNWGLYVFFVFIFFYFTNHFFLYFTEY